jgi:hypothetical protein
MGAPCSFRRHQEKAAGLGWPDGIFRLTRRPVAVGVAVSSCSGSNLPDPIVRSAKKKICTPSLWNILGMNRGSLKSPNIPFFSKRQSWSNLGSSMHALHACVLPILILVHACIFRSKFLAHANLNKTNKPWKQNFHRGHYYVVSAKKYEAHMCARMLRFTFTIQ